MFESGTYRGPTGRPIDAAEENRLVRLALNDAWMFEVDAPKDRDFWGIFWSALERSQDRRFVTGAASLMDFAAPPVRTDGGKSNTGTKRFWGER
jgi:hypothetical protein